METFFHFNFNNPFGFLLPFVPAVINLSLIVYIYLYFVRNRITTIFSLLILSLACWQLNSAVGRIAYDAQTMAAWESFFMISWSLVGPLCLHFSFLYSQIIDERKWQPLLFASYIITFFFIGLYNADVYEHHFVYNSSWGWVDEHKENLLDTISVSWLTFLSLTSIFILNVHAYRMRHKGDYFYQAVLIAAGITIPAVIGIIAQYIFPLLLHIESLPITSVFMSVFSFATVIALSKYNLFHAADIFEFDKILDSIPAYLICINEEGKINYVNHYTCKKLELAKTQLINTPIEQAFVFPSDNAHFHFTSRIKAAMEGKETLDFESSLIVNNRVVQTLMSIRPITNISNAHGIVIAIQDVTEMSKAHEMVEHSEMQLREAQRIAKIGSWEWEVATNEVTWSEELYRIYGLPYSPKKKTYEEFLQTMSEEGRAKMNTIVQKAFQTKEPYTYVRKMSGDRIIQGNGYVMVDEQGKVERMYGTVQDITNIAKKEEQLQIQNEELHKINSELDRFVYSVSHDLRAPLTSIEGLVDIALDETQEASIQQYLSMIKASTAKLDRFIQDILHYSRNARMDLSIDTVNLHELLNDIVDHHHLPNQKKVQINVSIKAPLPLLTDKTRLMLILNNIISNSVRYSNPKTPQPYVNIEINVSSRHADFVISDNGQGISDSIRPHVFEMFYRGNRDSVGSGLGLYIVKEAVEKLHGTITMQSQVDEGTTFAISIPNYYNTQDF